MVNVKKKKCKILILGNYKVLIKKNIFEQMSFF